MSFKKENGRYKPATPTEVADVTNRGKLFICPICGHQETRFKVEFAELPKCPKCKSGLLNEHLEV
jgi:predicted Zn-ribbon and HTH transcriptional regulator